MRKFAIGFGLGLCALALLRLALMATIPVFDPSEARYAAISANMARSGDFVVPHFTYRGAYQSFDGKPPLVFQAGGVFCRALGTTRPESLQFAVRLFPFLSALLTLGILFATVRRFADASAGRLAVAICATCTAFYAAAGMSMTDMSLTACVAGALLLYRWFATDFRFGLAVAIMALMGAGMIVKGPVALVLFGLPVLLDAAVNRRWRTVFNWKWLVAAPAFFLIAVPWFVLVEQRNPGSVWYFFYNENFLRFVTHDYGDKYGAGREAFRGVSIVWAFVATLPWALVPVFRYLRRTWTTRRFAIGCVRSFPFLACTAIIGFWCLTSRVLLYYLFPMIPLFAAGLAVYGDRAILRRLARPCALVTIAVTVGALVGGMCLSDKMQGASSPQTHGRHNRYSHEFYHGTDPGDIPTNAPPKSAAASSVSRSGVGPRDARRENGIVL